ncbi:MAG TPA: sigma-70 family RNA polymerase sigma factor, partial [Pyrinomonadaceae bacterium]
MSTRWDTLEAGVSRSLVKRQSETERRAANPAQRVGTSGHVADITAEQPQQTDYSLAQRAASGDMACFESLYERHHRRVYSLCLRMTSNTAEAEDLAQEVFIQLFRKIGSFRGESAFTTWLHRLTVNQVLMHFRKK